MTFPSGPIVASIVTAPETRADCAMAGYTGLTSLILFGGLIRPPTRTGATLAFALAAGISLRLDRAGVGNLLGRDRIGRCLVARRLRSDCELPGLVVRLEPLAFLSFQLGVERGPGILGSLERLGGKLTRAGGVGPVEGGLGRIHVRVGRRCAARDSDREAQGNRAESDNDTHGVSLSQAPSQRHWFPLWVRAIEQPSTSGESCLCQKEQWQEAKSARPPPCSQPECSIRDSLVCSTRRYYFRVVGLHMLASWRPVVTWNRHMSTVELPDEQGRVRAERVRERAEDRRQDAEQSRDETEQHRDLAESSRKAAEQFRELAEEAREVRDRYREELENTREDQERFRRAAEDARTAAEDARHATETARQAAEDARHATIESVAATADSLHSTLEQMKFLEEARRTIRDLKDMKPPEGTH